MGKISRFLSHELGREPHFGLLFLMLLLALALPAFLPPGTTTELAVQLFISGILLVGLTSVSSGKRLMLVGILLVLPAIALHWLARLVDARMVIIANALAIVFLLYLSALIINYLFRTNRADANTIYGAICVFMLIGFIWGLAFFVFEVVDPYSLSVDGTQVTEDIGGLLEATSTSIYLSFVTLTTLGYGDVIPTTAPTRTLAMIEAILGQLFLVVMIARFVGLNVAHSMREAEKRTARAAAEAVKSAEAQAASGKKSKTTKGEKAKGGTAK